MEQKTTIALILLVGFALLMHGCTGQGSAQPQSQQAGNAPQDGQIGNPGQPQSAAPAGNGTAYQPATGIASLSENDTNVATGDNDGSGYTELPVDDGSDTPVIGG